MSSERTDAILVLNCGSSSVKFAVIDPRDGATPMSGLAERIGQPDAVLHVKSDGAKVTHAIPGASSHDAVRRIVGAALELADVAIVGVGHRVVHGAERFTESVLVDDAVLTAVRECSRLAPLHNPVNLAGIEAARDALPGVPQVAVFDTAFHQTMPAHAFRYAVPTSWYDDLGVRRYGFHGTSHRFVTTQAAALLDRPVSAVRLVTVHLGNGCSATAVKDGVSVDTTMGLTPLEGLVMGTRSGDVDPGMFGYIAAELGLDVDGIVRELNSASGLLGLSEVSNDMRTVSDAATAGDPKAQLALDVFTYRLAKAIAALAVPLERLDAVVFTGGIGENSAPIRSAVLARLGLLGLREDVAANAVNGRDTGGRVSEPGAPVALVVPTNEELLIARDTAELLNSAGGRPPL